MYRLNLSLSSTSGGTLQRLSASAWNRRKFSRHIQVGVSKFDL